MLTCRCPICDGEIDGVPPIQSLRYLRITPQCRRVLDALIDAYPDDVPNAKLVHELYWDDIDGGTDDPLTILRNRIYHIRKAVRALGWEVPKSSTSWGVRGRYRLQPLPDRSASA